VLRGGCGIDESVFAGCRFAIEGKFGERREESETKDAYENGCFAEREKWIARLCERPMEHPD
jgi:hypothetical protein